MDIEHGRLEEARTKEVPWRKWGPYLSDRQWGTVREDYSDNGDAWNFFTHDHARSRAYRWGEDGLGGISDDKQRLCFALALWNGKDPILKERLFGLTNSEGNHGEDVKEYYFYLDSTPTHSYMKFLYKYPQAAYPYADLVETNRRRSRNEMEYELPRHRRLRRGPLLRRVRRVREGVARGHPDPDHGPQPRSRGGRAARAADPLVPQRLGDVDRPSRRETDAQADRGTGGHEHDCGAHAVLGAYYLYCEGDGAAALHRELDQPRQAPPRLPGRGPVPQGRHQRLCRPGPAGGGEPRAARHQGRRALPADDRPRPIGDGAAAPHCPGAGRVAHADQRRRRPLREGLRRDPGRPAAGGRRVLQVGDPALGLPGCRQRDAPGPRRHALVQAVLLLGRRRVAGGAPRPPPPSRQPRLPEPRVVPHDQRRHHLHARQVGVPLVRRLGPRLPHAADRDRGPRLREAADGADAPRGVPASQRPASRLRVELQRREPAGARLGDALPAPHRAGPPGRGRSRLPQGRRSTSSC